MGVEATSASWDALWLNVNLATMSSGGGPYGAIRQAAIAVKEGRIAWCGREVDLPRRWSATRLHHGSGAWLTPGLIDCHTHVVHAGTRADEFEARAEGKSYKDIAAEGGGILSTVRATRAATEDQLLAQSLRRVDCLLREGVTTLEVKSGYGLDLETERRMLRVARSIADKASLTVRTTYLGLHVVPPEFAHASDEYVRYASEEVLPCLVEEGLVDAVDAFCENIAFTPKQVGRFFRVARQLQLPVKLHAEQLSRSGGAVLLGSFRGLSADHLEYARAEDVSALRMSGCAAVLLPGAFHFLRETQRPPVEALRTAGVPIAVSTDCNPGTSPMPSILAAMSLACTHFNLTPEEALLGTTRNAAKALGLESDRGMLEVGKRADFAVWEVNSPAEIVVGLGNQPCLSRVVFGNLLGVRRVQRTAEMTASMRESVGAAIRASTQ